MNAQEPSSKLLTLPNYITFARILCIPFVVYALLTNQPFYGLVFFTIAAASDALDGFIARYMKTRSKLGAYLDPLADKLLFLFTFLTLGYLNVIPFGLIVLSVYRDIMIILGICALTFYRKPFEMKPLFISKLNTFIQSIVVVLFLCIKAFSIQHMAVLIVAYICVYCNIITLLASGIAYILKGLENLHGYGFVYVFLGIFVCLFIAIMNTMMADFWIIWELIRRLFRPLVYRV